MNLDQNLVRAPPFLKRDFISEEMNLDQNNEIPSHTHDGFYQLGNELRPEHQQPLEQLICRFYQLGNELRPERCQKWCDDIWGFYQLGNELRPEQIESLLKAHKILSVRK